MNRVVFFLDKYPNLSETFVADQISGLLKRGLDIRIVAISGDLNEVSPELEEQFSISSRIQYLTKPRRGRFNALTRLLNISANLHRREVRLALRSDLYGPSAKNGLLAELAGNITNPIHANVIISHFGTTSVTALALMKLGLLQGNLVPVFHGFDLSVHQVQQDYILWYRQLFKLSARVFAISQLWLQRLEEMGCPRAKLELLRMGVDPDKFNFHAAGSLSKKLSIISVGRLTDKKGYITALKGIKAAVDLGVTLHYTIIGDGHLRQTLVRMINDLDISDYVTLAGAVAPTLLPCYLRQADIFMLTSETAVNGDMEGIPVSLMEAMSSGLITVSTYHSGIPELITHQENGFLIAERDHASLARLLKDIASGLYDLDSVRQSARNKVSQDFNQQCWVTRLHEICTEINNAS